MAEEFIPVPEFEDIKQAHKRIKPFIHHTPVMTSKLINEITGGFLFFKCENLQKVGAFKYRGATNAVLSLSDEQAARGVATHSSGNHAAALALAARSRGIKAYIVMPENAPEVKKIAVQGYGAEITFCEPTLAAREQTLEKVVARTGAAFIHPYNNFNVVCGQGTAALELIEDIGIPDIMLAPIGGGGLMSGTALTTRALAPDCSIYGTEPAGADDACRSFKAGHIIPSDKPKTIADGLLTSLSTLTFSVIKNNLDDIVTVTEEEIVIAM
ncbi:MAG TPA: pyridoxal-phosphate dependent enzyme, partial [Bacteroidales bacterium]|nr:pyridoxal-phosphate dependent enzyme [Bacteroidales bacterium]